MSSRPAVITSAQTYLVDIEVETERTDAVQAFLKQETIFVELATDDGLSGTGYTYTIGTGGHAVLAMVREFLPRLLGADARGREPVAWVVQQHPGYHRRRDHLAGAGRGRHRALGSAVPAGRGAAVVDRRRARGPGAVV
jgi:L-alanine-DL-glutamate epimerase-like enolase superfamily enzyme